MSILIADLCKKDHWLSCVLDNVLSVYAVAVAIILIFCMK